MVINENLGIEMPQDPLNDWMQELTIEFVWPDRLLLVSLPMQDPAEFNSIYTYF